MDSDNLDLIIVPGVAFDKTGSRLGRGKGYYDNYLSKAKHKFPLIKTGMDDLIMWNEFKVLIIVTTVGIAFLQQILEPGAIPMMEYDQRLDYLLCSEFFVDQNNKDVLD